MPSVQRSLYFFFLFKNLIVILFKNLMGIVLVNVYEIFISYHASAKTMLPPEHCCDKFIPSTYLANALKLQKYLYTLHQNTYSGSAR
jgi:hypothetical protein